MAAALAALAAALGALDVPACLSSLSRCLSSLVSLLLLGWRLLVGVVGVVSLFFLILFFARARLALGLGGQEALLVEVASGVLEDPEVASACARYMYPDVF